MDFNFIYDVLSENGALYNEIKEKYFRVLGQLHSIVPIIKVSKINYFKEI